MWTSNKCDRIFHDASQSQSCKKVHLQSHFISKPLAHNLFDHLVHTINSRIGTCKIISIPCYIHLFGNYDFLAALPKKDHLEIRFALDQKIPSPKLTHCVPLSQTTYKNCFKLTSKQDLDSQLLSWIKASYHLKD